MGRPRRLHEKIKQVRKIYCHMNSSFYIDTLHKLKEENYMNKRNNHSIEFLLTEPCRMLIFTKSGSAKKGIVSDDESQSLLVHQARRLPRIGFISRRPRSSLRRDDERDGGARKGRGRATSRVWKGAAAGTRHQSELPRVSLGRIRSDIDKYED